MNSKYYGQHDKKACNDDERLDTIIKETIEKYTGKKKPLPLDDEEYGTIPSGINLGVVSLK